MTEQKWYIAGKLLLVVIRPGAHSWLYSFDITFMQSSVHFISHDLDKCELKTVINNAHRLCKLSSHIYHKYNTSWPCNDVKLFGKWINMFRPR